MTYRLRAWVVALSVMMSILMSGRSSAQYDIHGNRQNATRPQVPACDAAKAVVCLVDSTRTLSTECCMDVSTSQWLILSQAGDSIELFAVGKVDPYVTLYKERGAWQEHDINSASYLRLRVPETAPYRLTVDLDVNLIGDPTVVPYELRVHTMPARRIGATPLLRIVGDKHLKVRVRAIAPRMPEPRGAGVSVSPGVYRLLAPGIDSVEVCRIPCKTPRTFAVEGPPSRTIRP